MPAGWLPHDFSDLLSGNVRVDELSSEAVAPTGLGPGGAGADHALSGSVEPVTTTPDPTNHPGTAWVPWKCMLML